MLPADVFTHTITVPEAAIDGESLTVLTWIGGFEAQTSPRHTLFWRERDRKILARAQTVWVFVDADSGRATRIPEDFRSSFELVSDEKDVLRWIKGSGLSTHPKD